METSVEKAVKIAPSAGVTISDFISRHVTDHDEKQNGPLL